MHVVCFRSLDELAAYAEPWDALCDGMPMRSWAWSSAWWRCYGQHKANRRLYVLGVFDRRHALVALAPWYEERTAGRGRIVRFLGSGEVCSDYLGLSCAPGAVEPATDALAEWLHRRGRSSRGDEHWDLLDLDAVAVHDHPTLALIDSLAASGSQVVLREGTRCWRLPLPDCWEAYLGRLSKSHRKQVRRFQREMFDSGRAVLHTVDRRDQIPEAMDLLVQLHQQRRRALGQPGCFASPRFEAFHRQVLGPLLCGGNLHLHWLSIDGRPAAAEYHVSGHGVMYAYQAGVAPASIEHEPGSLITLATLRRAVDLGFRAFDFLRGDEPYKAHWRAEPMTMLRVRVAADCRAARMRMGLWRAAARVKHWGRT